MEHVPITYEGVEDAYEPWVDGMGWLMVALALVFIPLIALLEYCKAHGFIRVSAVYYMLLKDKSYNRLLFHAPQVNQVYGMVQSLHHSPIGSVG